MISAIGCAKINTKINQLSGITFCFEDMDASE